MAQLENGWREADNDNPGGHKKFRPSPAMKLPRKPETIIPPANENDAGEANLNFLNNISIDNFAHSLLAYSKQLNKERNERIKVTREKILEFQNRKTILERRIKNEHPQNVLEGIEMLGKKVSHELAQFQSFLVGDAHEDNADAEPLLSELKGLIDELAKQYVVLKNNAVPSVSDVATLKEEWNIPTIDPDHENDGG